MSLKHALPRHIHVPDKTQQEPNWQEVEKFSRIVKNDPVAVSMTGDPGALPAAGTFTDIVWTANTDPRLDQYHFITGTADVRIPIDGYYDFWFTVAILDVPTANGFLEFRLMRAPTSDSGFGAPVFAAVGSRQSAFLLNGWNQGEHFMVDSRGLELHANDLLHFQLRILGQAGAFTATTVDAAEFRYSYPIPDGR